jgi:hypothetical protein
VYGKYSRNLGHKLMASPQTSFEARVTFWGLVRRSHQRILHLDTAIGETIPDAVARCAKETHEEALQDGRYGPGVLVTVEAEGIHLRYPRPALGHYILLPRGKRKIVYSAEGIVEVEDAPEKPIPICDLWPSPDGTSALWIIDSSWVDGST